MKRAYTVTRAAIVGLAGLLSLSACQTTPKADPIVSIPPRSFVKGWSASVGNQQPLTSMYLVGDQLYVYSKDNQSFVFSAPSGKVIYNDQIAMVGSPLREPIALPDKRILYPIADGLVIYDKPGKRLSTVRLGKTTTGGGVAQAYTVYMGISGSTGGRLAALDLTPRSATPQQLAMAKKLGVAVPPGMIGKWEVYTGAAITSKPAVYQGAVYAGAEDGQVWAVNESGNGIWQLPGGGHTFQAAGPIHADLKVDDAGVYAASLDGKLYCIDRGSGRVKWAYYASSPLEDAPVLGASTVYQAVPDYGLVAIDKRTAGVAKPKWVSIDAVKFLVEDEKYVYAVKRGGGLIALDKLTGLNVFQSTKRDLTVFATDPKTTTIFGATKDGVLYSVKPVLVPGVMGQIALETMPAPFEPMAQATFAGW